MRRLAPALLLVALVGQAWGATYYVDPAGNDTTGDGSSGTPWATLGKAWATANAATTNTINVAAGNYYAEVQNAAGGPNTGVTWTFQFAAGQTNVRIATSASAYIFRPTAGRAGTTIFQGGSTGATKTTKFDLGTYGDGSQFTGASASFTASTVTGSLYVFRDIEFDAENSANASSWITSASAWLDRCYVHGFKRATTGPANGPLTVTASYFYNTTGLTFGANANAFTFDNNTVNYVGYVPASGSVLASSAGTKSGPVRVRNNLFVTDASAATPRYFVQINSGHVVSDYLGANNIGWRISALSAPRTVNDYVANYDANSLVPNRVIAVDPHWAGSSTTPSVASDSLTIGRGLDVGVTTDYAGVAYPSPSIGCSAVAGGTKQYLTPTAKKILVVGDSWVYEEPPVNAKWATKMAADLAARGYSLVTMPGGSGPPGLSGNLFNRFRGLATELAQATSPGIIVMEGGINDARATPPWSGALLGAMHNYLADDLASLYQPGAVRIVSIGAQPLSGVTPDTTQADLAEAAIAAHFAGKANWYHLGFTAAAKLRGVNPYNGHSGIQGLYQQPADCLGLSNPDPCCSGVGTGYAVGSGQECGIHPLSALESSAGGYAFLASLAGAVVAPYYTLTCTAGTGGTVTPSGAVSVEEGGSQAFTATPSAGYKFKSLGGQSQNPYTVTNVTQDATIEALFQRAGSPSRVLPLWMK